MMRETIKSLRIYFVIIGVFNLLPIGNVLMGNVLRVQSDFFVGISTFISLIFGFLYLYFGARLKAILFKSSKLIINVLVAEALYAITLFLYQLISSGFKPVTLIVLGVVLVINLYLIANVNRLAKEKRSLP